MEIPVYLFTGFLEAGKTRFLQETLSDPTFFERGPERTLVLLCEEGEEELDPTEFVSPDVFVQVIDEPRRINPDKLTALRDKYRATRLLVEYNGMWLIPDLLAALPPEWFVCQQIFFADASTIEVYNANMRNLVVDKINGSDVVVFNRCDENTDYDALHKLVRAVSRRPNIVYERVDGTSAYDDIEDPLPFDVNAPVIEVGDGDYALFYRDLSENMDTYDGKTVRFLGQVNSKEIKAGFVIGRPIMTCCEADITFSGLLCRAAGEPPVKGSWIRLTAKIRIKRVKLYGRKGPVLEELSREPAPAPEKPVATFF